MTEAKGEKRPIYANDPYFERWILRDAWDGFWYNLPIILIALCVFVVFGLISTSFQLDSIAQFVKQGIMPPEVPILTEVLTLAVNIVLAMVMAVLMYTVHSSVIDGATCWLAFSQERRSRLFLFLKRSLMIVVVVFALSVVQQHLLWTFVFQNMMEGDNSAASIIAPLSGIVSIAFIVAAILICTWPVSALLNGDTSIRRAVARGKKVFWYIVGKHLAVLPAMVLLQIVLLVVAMPMLGAMFSGDAGADGPVVPMGLVAMFSILGGVLVAAFCCIEAVIISRALLIGEARLNGSSDQTENTELPSESMA